MKKILVIMLVILTVLGINCAHADEFSSMTFDNVTFGKNYKIKGYASINLLGFKFVNMYAQWEAGRASKEQDERRINKEIVLSKKANGNRGTYFTNCHFVFSGLEAEFAWLKVDITNQQKIPVNFMKEITVKVIFDDEYEYDGWVRQFNYDYSKSEIYRYQETTVIGWPVCLSPADEMPIDLMYKGHYAFGCTLPNYVVKSKSPLRMIIAIGNHKLTYNIR